MLNLSILLKLILQGHVMIASTCTKPTRACNGEKSNLRSSGFIKDRTCRNLRQPAMINISNKDMICFLSSLLHEHNIPVDFWSLFL